MGRLASVTVAVALATLMLASALPMLAPELSPLGAVAAEGESIATYVWDGEGTTALASEAANWYQDIGGVITNDIAPTNNSNIRYDATSVKSCTWDLAYPQFVAYSLTLAIGYTGTLTQGDVDIGIGAGGYLQEDGTFAGNAARRVYCAGTFSPGALVLNSLNLVMIGTDTAITSTTVSFLRSLTVSADMTIPEGVVVRARQITIESMATVENRGRLIQTTRADVPYLFVNMGDLYGPGIFSFYSHVSDITWIPGELRCDVLMSMSGVGQGHRTITLGAPLLASALEVRSEHSTYTLTLDLNGHSLTAASVTVGERGNILWGEGTHSIGSLDTSAGASDFETSHIIMEQNGTVKLGAGQSIPSLEIVASTIAPSWTFGSAGAWAWNVTGLDPGYAYNYYVGGELQDELPANASGVIALTAETTEETTFELRRVPIISPVPLHPGHHTRHNVDEGITYSVRYTCDQPVTWSISGAPFLSIDQNGVISGMPGILDSGEYLVTVTAANANGADVVTFELTVEDSLQPVTNEVNGVVPIVVALIVLSSVVTLLGGLYNRMKF